jgi:hypothetical protein
MKHDDICISIIVVNSADTGKKYKSGKAPNLILDHMISQVSCGI